MTEAQRKLILEALDAQVETYNRSKGKSKRPEFEPVYAKLIAEVRDAQAAIRELAVSDDKKK